MNLQHGRITSSVRLKSCASDLNEWEKKRREEKTIIREEEKTKIRKDEKKERREDEKKGRQKEKKKRR